jgi:phosphoribosylformylglycinamidine synthase
MLLIVKQGREAEVEAIFEKWDLHAVRIGEVTADNMLRIRDHGVLVAEVPNRALTDEGPVYRRPFQPPADLADRQRMPTVTAGILPTSSDALLQLLGTPGIASKRWIYRQFDYMVRTNTIVLAGLGAAVVRVKGTNRALAMSVDGNGRFCQLDPRQGARLAVAEASRNVACAGGEPIGATNCLNFGNPERPEIMWQFAEAVAGIGEACRALGTPITGGNVSLYNETDGRPILPTPVIGVVGVIEDSSHVRTRVFPEAGLDIVLLGDNLGELGGSEYLKTIVGTIAGTPPALDLARERALQQFLVSETGVGVVRSAHDCSDGGFAVALTECCCDSGGIGADVEIPSTAGDGGIDREAATLFGESATRVILSVHPSATEALLARARAAGVAAARIGRTGGSQVRIRIDGQPAIDCLLGEAEAKWATGFSQWLETHG